MEDRQCKICLQYKPLEEFVLWGAKNRRSFTCRDCEQITAPVQPTEFASKFNARPIPMCCVENCDEPVTDGHPKCYRHMLEQWAETRNNLRPHSDTNRCVEPGCVEPRAIMKSGKLYPRCEEHQKIYNAAKNRGSRQRKRAAQPLTEAQQHAGFDRNPETAASKGDVRKVCIIDRRSDVMIFMEIKITRACKTGESEMPPPSVAGCHRNHRREGIHHRRTRHTPGRSAPCLTKA